MNPQPSRRPRPRLSDVLGRMDRFLERRVGARRPDGTWSVAVDARRRGDVLTILADLPGVDPGNLHISVQDRVLTVAGEPARLPDGDEHEGYLQRERPTGAFRRSIALPAEADVDGITATARNGVAEITIPLGTGTSSPTIDITATAA